VTLVSALCAEAGELVLEEDAREAGRCGPAAPAAASHPQPQLLMSTAGQVPQALPDLLAPTMPPAQGMYDNCIEEYDASITLWPGQITMTVEQTLKARGLQSMV
jgi:hypothetical protein